MSDDTVATADSTRDVAVTWFGALASGDIGTAAACLADDVEWINYRVVPGYNDVMPWIGTYRGPQSVLDTFKIFTDLVTVQSEELVRLVVEGEEAAGIVHEVSVVKETGSLFDIEFVQWLTIRDGKIVRWKSYTDPSPIIAAFAGEDKGVSQAGEGA